MKRPVCRVSSRVERTSLRVTILDCTGAGLKFKAMVLAGLAQEDTEAELTTPLQGARCEAVASLERRFGVQKRVTSIPEYCGMF